MRYQEFTEDNRLLDKPTSSPEELAKKHGVSLEYINQQLARGIKVETEHTSHKDIAREIALDHLGEEPDYYEKLAKVEVDEDWKSALATGAMAGAMALGGAGTADAKAPAAGPQTHKTAAVQKHRVDPTSTKVQALVHTKQIDPQQAYRILSQTAIKAGITNPTELAQFLAQCSAETGNFKHLGEIGRPARLAKKYSHSTGNQGKFDALEYAGRGFIQLTGKSNYIEAGAGVHGDESRYVEHPDLAADPHEAAKIAVWFWNKNVKPRVKNWSDTAAVTRAINGRGAPTKEIEKRHGIFAQYAPAVQNWASRQGRG